MTAHAGMAPSSGIGSGSQPTGGTTGVRAVPEVLNGAQGEYVEALYKEYLVNPEGVPADLRSFFQGFDLALDRGVSGGATATGTTATAQSNGTAPHGNGAIESLIAAYRALGHFAAKIDPLNAPRKRPATLSIESHGLSAADLNKPVPGQGGQTLQQLVTALEQTYCGSLGFEYTHLPEQAEREWFRSKIEANIRSTVTNADKVEILTHMTAAEGFEKFLGRRYQGKKRFSLEGGESLIPVLKFITERAGQLGTVEIVLGMAHRGRLNVLKNYLGKDLQKLFTEFEDAWNEGANQGGGDVKYHRGYSGDQILRNKGVNTGDRVHLSMLNNPSHLESVNPIVMGRARAKQDITGDTSRRKVIPLLIHGDAAVQGQGIVAECLNMSKLAGYDCGGTLHVVINNQVGFTTDPSDSRSTPYCTDIGKMINTPVIHVNGDDPVACVAAAMLAVEYRHEFGKDVFIDIVCFRRFGHNEQDEPGYTQPALYAAIKKHPGTLALFSQQLVAEGVVSADKVNALAEADRAELDAGQTLAQKSPVNPVPAPGGGQWEGLSGTYSFDSPKTAVDAKTLAAVCAAFSKVPDGFNVHPKLKGLLEARSKLHTLAGQGKKLSHADAEQLAIGTLVAQGVPVRLSGQDCRRGTFTQRHAVLRDELNGERYTPLNAIAPDQKAQFSVWDSPLSEFSVMGFDYGYCRAHPRTLVMWEGQFGDFVNGAQVMIDQYLASSEVKWHRWAGLVLLLPHGYEGQGPEHSSARLERFLQLCADQNMEVVYPSTGDQVFHMLRRQALRTFRKPLIVMTPKKYLRVETGTIDALLSGSFQHFIDDSTAKAGDVSTVLYCSGKLYHSLNERRVALGRKDIALVRVEQLYPFHTEVAKKIDTAYPKSAKRVWVQEEPRNQGAYLFIADVFREQLGVNLGYIGRPASASPATGSEKAHEKQQEAILAEAVGPAPKTAVTEAKPAVAAKK